MRTPGAPLLAILTLAAMPLAAQNGSTIRGRVLSSAGQPLAGAMVIRMQPVGGTVRADSGGRYAVEHVGPGHYVFRFAARGYEPMEAELTLGGDTVLDVDVPLEPAAPLSVPSDRDEAGFNRRRLTEGGRRNGPVFLDAADIAARNVTRVTQLLNGIHDVEVRSVDRFAAIYGDGGRCTMPVWIGSQQSTDFFPYVTTRGLDDVLLPDQIAGIEVYPHDTQVPREFQRPIVPVPVTQAYSIRTARRAPVDYETRTTHCGVIVIWTK